MKLKEIKNYVTDGEYSVSMGIKYLVAKIEEWVVEDDLEINSDFQRGHVWTESQQIAWVEYFLRGGKSGCTLYFNAAWWGDYDKSKFEYADFVLVDGLQRLTAIKRFVTNDLPVFGGNYIDDFEDSLKRRVLRYNLTININSLRSKREVLTWYIQMNSGGTPHTQAEIDKVDALLNAEKLIGGTTIMESYLLCLDCEWYGYADELEKLTDDATDKDFTHCPDCGGTDFEMIEDDKAQ